MLKRQVDFALDLYADDKLPQDDWDLVSLNQRMGELTNQAVRLTPQDLSGKTREELRDLLINRSNCRL